MSAMRACAVPAVSSVSRNSAIRVTGGGAGKHPVGARAGEVAHAHRADAERKFRRGAEQGHREAPLLDVVQHARLQPHVPDRLAIEPLPVPVAGGGQTARTHYRVVSRAADCTILALDLETGRTHQIRAHLASIGHPIVGDVTYGAPAPLAAATLGPRIALRAVSLALVHPTTGEPLHIDTGGQNFRPVLLA